MANPSTAQEPSMEEILASIRQIISEDGETSPAASEATPVPRAEKNPAETAETQDTSSSGPVGASIESAPAGPKVSDAPKIDRLTSSPPRPSATASAHTAARAAPSPRPEAPLSTLPTQRPSRPSEDRNLLSADSDAAVSGAFSALAHTILAQNARTLEDLVAEMLRPMLRDWLDENLPALVERLVKDEIQRVSRGRR